MSRGVSPAIVTMLLMAVAVSGSVAVWQSLSLDAQVAFHITKIDLLDASLVKLSGTEKSYLSVTIKNSGTVPLESVKAGFWDDDNSYFEIRHGSLGVREQFEKSTTFDAKITNYKEYALKISAKGTDDSTFAAVKTIRSFG